jgi:peroxiredoxin
MREMLAGALVLAGATSAFALEIGDKAPPLEVKEWVQGDPVVLADGAGKKVFVVEFWATWCPPCRESIPHLSKLAEKFKAQGLEVVGVSDEDVEKVREFAKDGKFKYHVAVDKDRNTNGVYMEGVNGIPHAFVVNKDGLVVWSGHPMAGLDGVIEKVLAGKFDVAKAKEAAQLRQAMQELFKSNDLDKIGEAADKLLAAAPDDQEGFRVKTLVLKNKKDEAGFKSFLTGLVPKVNDDAAALNAIAWSLATDENLGWRDIGTAMKASKRAVELSQGKDAAILDTLARVYFEAGMVDQAVEQEKKALAIDAADEAMKKTLAYYQSCAEVRKQSGGGAPPAPAPKKK